MILNSLLASATSIGLLLVCLVIIAVVVLVKRRRKVMQLILVLQKVASELHPKVRNHGEGPYAIIIRDGRL